ncbi:hypothetical protein PRIPAC_85029, partial [Pristionchus pacificus]|uniref:Uncharacterized protein n=1 Tax=Pristionchus pacificus TaxID=54126 RepID=A0A2A6BRP4_PRIPA
MALVRRVIALAALLQSSIALVEFTNSKLYDEKDFSVQAVSIDGFCNPGCRMYVSLPDSSADVAKQIVVHDYTHDEK